MGLGQKHSKIQRVLVGNCPKEAMGSSGVGRHSIGRVRGHVFGVGLLGPGSQIYGTLLFHAAPDPEKEVVLRGPCSGGFLFGIACLAIGTVTYTCVNLRRIFSFRHHWAFSPGTCREFVEARSGPRVDRPSGRYFHGFLMSPPVENE